jgi:hypothetical protein
MMYLDTFFLIACMIDTTHAKGQLSQNENSSCCSETSRSVKRMVENEILELSDPRK